MLQFTTTHHDFENIRAFEIYIEKQGLRVATNLEAPTDELLKFAEPDWNKKAQGCIIMFIPQLIGDEPDLSSRTGRKFVSGKPVLSRFFASICSPIASPIPKGQIVCAMTINNSD